MSTLTFFCGLHTSSDAKLQGGLGIMRAVTLQLLSSIPDATFSIPRFDPTHVAQQLAVGDLEMTCAVFNLVLENLPMGAVFVLIDGVLAGMGRRLGRITCGVLSGSCSRLSSTYVSRGEVWH
ncbi:hypothetical protein QBC43DRAFT_98026 [Cladorrhinum sp. PSN259]|nr:hypothetical protein QBC43DRAFT_98026 [Cladorrhinum sp. PSN259]